MRLWRHRDFLKLWAGQTISLLGTQVTGLALALTAAIVLQATPAEMGLIGTLNVLPFVLFGFPAGVWVDRVQRRWVLIGTDLARAGLLATVPVAAAAGRLNIPQLYLVSFGMGSLSVLFRVAYASYLPSLVNQADLADGNAKLALAEAIARVGGPSIAGVLVQVLTAPIAIVVDCISYVLSAGSLLSIGARERTADRIGASSLRGQIGQGLRAVFRHNLLRPLFLATTLGNAADGLASQSGTVVLFLTRELRLEAATVGGVIAGLGIGGLIGAALAGPLRHSVGLGATILGCLALWSVGYGGMAFTPPATIAPGVAAVLLGALGAINPIAGANISTIRQVVTPAAVLGRVTAVSTVGSAVAITLGSLLGGMVGDTLGVRATLFISGFLPLLGLASVALSPVRDVRAVDALAPEPST
jgi:predicted MFS family arabinose efflux permease